MHTQQRPLQVPHLERLGLGHAAQLASGRLPAGFDASITASGAWGVARERSTGKDTTSGHWEMMGVPMLDDWGYFRERENSMPATLLDAIAARPGIPGWPGNCPAIGRTAGRERGVQTWEISVGTGQI